jgi:DNA polymerase-3 subunit gamma/tau
VEGERGRGQPLAAKLSVPVLVRAWQMLLKGLAETQTAPSPLQAAEMVLVRLAYVADLPAPADLVRALSGDGVATPTPGARPPSGMSSGTAAPSMLGGGTGGPGARRSAVGETEPAGAPRMLRAAEPASAPVASPGLEPTPQSFLEVVALFDRKREALLRSHLFANVHLVRFEPGRIELRPTEGAPRDLANRLGKLLGDWTGERWVVSVSQNEGEPTLREQAAARDETLRHEAAAHPLVRAVLDAFPGARIEAVRDIGRDAAVSLDPETLADELGEGEP